MEDNAVSSDESSFGDNKKYIDDSSSSTNYLKLKETGTRTNKNPEMVSVSVLSPKNNNLKRKYVTDKKNANKMDHVARTINKENS